MSIYPVGTNDDPLAPHLITEEVGVPVAIEGHHIARRVAAGAQYTCGWVWVAALGVVRAVLAEHLHAGGRAGQVEKGSSGLAI
jgi:hypothetical protein